MRWKLRSAVGTGQPNRPDDVRIIQMLLNRSTDENKPHLLLKEDGIFGPKTSARILIFQIMNMHMWTFDGVVNPHGPTQLHLKNHKAKKTLHHSRCQTTLSHTKRKRNVICPDDEFAKLLEQKSKQDDKKTAWINRALPAAINVKAHSGVPIAVTIAQGALESSWGTKAPGNMFFGIKGKSPLGNSVNVTTHENLREGTVVIQDSFGHMIVWINLLMTTAVFLLRITDTQLPSITKMIQKNSSMKLQKQDMQLTRNMKNSSLP